MIISSCYGFSLWIGQRDAYISIIPIHDLIDESQSVSDWMSSDNCYTCTVNHFSPVEQYIDTTFLVTDTERHTVWSYVYPGKRNLHYKLTIEIFKN